MQPSILVDDSHISMMDVLERVNQHCGNKGLKFREGETHLTSENPSLPAPSKRRGQFVCVCSRQLEDALRAQIPVRPARSQTGPQQGEGALLQDERGEADHKASPGTH